MSDSKWCCTCDREKGYQERIAELEAERDRLRKIAERLEVLAVKWVDASHHDWPEIKKLSAALEEK